MRRWSGASGTTDIQWMSGGRGRSLRRRPQIEAAAKDTRRRNTENGRDDEGDRDRQQDRIDRRQRRCRQAGENAGRVEPVVRSVTIVMALAIRMSMIARCHGHVRHGVRSPLTVAGPHDKRTVRHAGHVSRRHQNCNQQRRDDQRGGQPAVPTDVAAQRGHSPRIPVPVGRSTAPTASSAPDRLSRPDTTRISPIQRPMRIVA